MLKHVAPLHLVLYSSFVFSSFLPLPERQSSCPTRLIYQYPAAGTWIENVAVRSNGDLLLTSLNHPGGLSVLGPSKRCPPKQVISSAELDYLNSTLGIVEAESDIFYILAANYSLAKETLGTQRGSNALFRVDFLACGGEEEDQEPSVQLVKKFGKEVLSLNGLTRFNDTLLLATDSVLGAIWAIDAESGEYYKLIQDELMEPPDPRGDGFKEGINGLHFVPHYPLKSSGGGTVYFTNSQKYLFGKVELDENGKVLGPAEWIADSITQDGVQASWDDFALDAESNAWIATEPGNGVQKVEERGRVNVVAGNVNRTELAEPTSAAFGRVRWDRHILYVTTAGGLGFPVWQDGKAEVVGAQVVAVDTRKCGTQETW